MSKTLTGFLILLIVCAYIPLVRSSYSADTLDDEKGSWVSMKNFVNCTIDEVDVAEGPFSYKFYSVNVTGYMLFGFEAATPLNLSGRFLILWLKVQNMTLENSLTFTLHDANDEKRGFWNAASWFALKPNMWHRVVIDLDNFQWENPDFDPTRVVRIKFVVYDEGRPYSQTVWIEDPAIFLEEQNQNYSLNNSINFSLILGVLFLLFIFYFLGFIVFNFLKLKLPYGGNLAVSLPMYMAVGISVLVLLLTLFCFVYFDVIVSWCISLVVIVSFFVIARKNLANFKAELFNLKKIEFLLPLFLFSFSLANFLRIALDMGWGAYVDSQTHGLFTSLIMFYKGFPSSSYPVGDIELSPIRYPMSFHALSAFDSFLTGAYPGQAILVVATALVSFLPSLFYSLVYLYSKSLKLSVGAFLLVFFLPGMAPALWRPSHDLLLGNYMVGTYPNILGNALLITFLAITIIFNAKGSDFSKQLLFLYGVLIIALCFTYYSLLPLIAAFILMKAFAFYFRKPNLNLKGYIGIATLLSASIICIFVIFFYKSTMSRFLDLNSSTLYTSYMRYSLFTWDSPYFTYAIFIFAAFPFSIWFLFKDKLRNLGLLFLAFFVPLMAAQNKQLYTDFLWFIQPDRALILLVVFSYVVVLLGLFEFFKLEWTQRRFHYSIQLRSKRRNFLGWLAVGCVLLLCAPSLLCHLAYSYPSTYKAALPSGNDFEALSWLANHVNSSEVILNDRSVMGLWASSFSAMNLINDREIILKIFLFGSLNGTYSANRTIEVNKILDYPWDYDGIEEIARKYNVSYIYLSENSLKLPQARGQDFWPFPWSHLTQKERMLMYLQNPDLEVVYRSGNAVIFKIKT